MPLVEKPGIRLVWSSSEELLTIHIRLASQILQSLNTEGSNLRVLLLQDVSIRKINFRFTIF